MSDFLIKSLFLLTFILSPVTVVADSAGPDFEREDRIVEQIAPDIFDGEAVFLTADDREFLAIHIEVDDAKGAIILLHGRDVNAEEQELIGPLRVGLAEQGWTTLSLQMPVLAKGKTYYDYLPILPYAHPRIEAAIDFLKTAGESKVIVAAHSCGAHMANHWLGENGDASIDGYIAMGLGATDAGQDLQTPFPIGDMTVPVLDLYGSEEFPRPMEMRGHRQQLLAQNGNPLSAQIELEGADHYFKGKGEEAMEIITNWLNQL